MPFIGRDRTKPNTKTEVDNASPEGWTDIQPIDPLMTPRTVPFITTRSYYWIRVS